jgi:hypothetical protein
MTTNDHGYQLGRTMSRSFLAALAILVGLGSPVSATELGLRVEALGCHSSQVSIGPSCETTYHVIGELSDAGSDGLSMVVFDLEFSGGSLLPADTPTALPMAAFAPPDGLSNPAGYGGTAIGSRLVQVGGSQNVLGHGLWPCEANDECPGNSSCVGGFCTALPGLPLGSVVIGAGQPGAAASIVTGNLVLPATPGTYTIQLSNPVANVLEKGVDGRPYWWNAPVLVQSVEGLTITVVPGQDCCDAYEPCCLPDASCTYVPPAECTALGGTPSGTDCEGDADGDGADGSCGDQCPNDPDKVFPGVCGCGVPDLDSDNDGSPDCIDGCPDDPDKIEPGVCGCGVPDVDSDGDTVPDCIDVCPGQDDLVDQDANGIPDCLENGAVVPAVSTWGIAITVLLLMVVSGFYLRRRGAAD